MTTIDRDLAQAERAAFEALARIKDKSRRLRAELERDPDSPLSWALTESIRANAEILQAARLEVARLRGERARGAARQAVRRLAIKGYVADYYERAAHGPRLRLVARNDV
jgi:hypothetical protein